MHGFLLQKKYPYAEIGFSCPRLRPIINNDKINPKDVHEPQLLQVICAYRIFMPFASITISTRECERFRNNIINIAATKISAGVDVGIGGHSGEDIVMNNLNFQTREMLKKCIKQLRSMAYSR